MVNPSLWIEVVTCKWQLNTTSSYRRVVIANGKKTFKSRLKREKQFARISSETFVPGYQQKNSNFKNFKILGPLSCEETSKFQSGLAFNDSLMRKKWFFEEKKFKHRRKKSISFHFRFGRATPLSLSDQII